MPLVRWQERHRRMNHALEEAWTQGGKAPDDPGLRDAYEEVLRAPIRIIVLPLGKAINHGGITRVADAYRIERVDFAREEDRAIDFAGQRGTKGWQPWRWNDPLDSIREAKQDGFTVAALTLSNRAVDIAECNWAFPLAIVVGAENEGIPSQIEDLCDLSIAVPMYGLVASLNVVTATALCLEYAVRRYAATHREFQPVRRGSRRLLGMEPLDFTSPCAQTSEVSKVRRKNSKS